MTPISRHKTSSILTSTSLRSLTGPVTASSAPQSMTFRGSRTSKVFSVRCWEAGRCLALSVSDRANRCGCRRRPASATAGLITTAGTRYSTTGAIRCSTLDRSAYTLVPTYARTTATVRPGTQNAGQLEAPGRRRVDLTIAKSFTLRGRTQLQVRAESFNAFNWRQYNDPVTNITAANFGRITSVSATRTGQVGFRLTF